jgi:molecular chaperone DnaK (HSP70)
MAMQEICAENAKKFITREESEKSDAEIKELLQNLENSLKDYHNKIDNSEGKHIAYIITTFAEDLKKGEKKSETSYRAVLEYYDYYKDILKMNSFVEKEMHYIISKMGE